MEAFVPAEAGYACRDPDAPALVCVPGLGMDGTCFLRQLPLGRRTDLHLLRLPAYAARGEKGLGHFAHYVERYVRALDLERRGVILLGSSMGGAVALTVAARRRIRVHGLALIGTFGHRRHLNLHQRMLTRCAWMLPECLIRSFSGPLLRRSESFGRFAPDEAAFMHSCVRIPSRGYLIRAASAVRQLDLLDHARGLTTPVLVLHGTEDRVLPLEAGRELAQTIPGARLVQVEKGGHAVFFLEHEAVNAAVAGFVREVRAARAEQPWTG